MKQYQKALRIVGYHVIARKGEALTWQSPDTVFAFAEQIDTRYQEIATSLRSSQ